MIVLVGFMGAGKSAVGRLLAEELELPFVDTDVVVQKRAGATIQGIFSQGGEEAFRSLEREVVADVVAGEDAVVALGGGAVTDRATRAVLMDALVVYLETSYATLIERVDPEAGDRPMLGLEDPRDLFNRRRTLYEEVADLAVQTDAKDARGVAHEIAALYDVFSSTNLTRVWVPLGERGYPVYVGSDLVRRSDYLLPFFAHAELVYVITHPELAELAVPVAAALEARDLVVHVGAVPQGEDSKSIAAAAVLYDELAKAGAHRHDLVVAVGGGVVTDLAGFVASTYHRGMPVVHVPTTLLGQVDAAIGGKTGINLAHGKNLVGTIHHPAAVICDVALLKTLPDEEFVAGLAEVLKYGFIAQPEILEAVRADAEALHARDERALSAIVARCAAIKAEVVAEDEREEGIRAHLNYGHTFAHAIEAATGFKGIRHGEAVALGMMAAAHLARELGRIDEGVVDVHRRILDAVGLPTTASLDFDTLAGAWQHDKKYQGGVRFVLLDDLGVPRPGVRASKVAISTALERMRAG